MVSIGRIGLWTPPPTGTAVELPPMGLPDALARQYQDRPVYHGQPGELDAVTGYQKVRDILVQGLDSRQVPIPDELKHATLFAPWGVDGVVHHYLRGTLTPINRGSSDAARQFTRSTTTTLLGQLMAEQPPWNLSRVVYLTSMLTMVKQTLQAPPLHDHIQDLQRLVREHVTTPGGFFAIQRQPEAEAILWKVVQGENELPEGSLARRLVEQFRAEKMSNRQLLGILWLLVVSSETQATASVNAITGLLSKGHDDYARDCLKNSEAMKKIVAEVLRLGLVFPASLITLGGQPQLLSYAAANRDPAVFGDTADYFDPICTRPAHLAFGIGSHRCQGELGTEQFIRDVLEVMLQMLPPCLQLVDGVILRETAGISYSIPEALVA